LANILMQLDGTRRYITATIKVWNYYLFYVTLIEHFISLNIHHAHLGDPNCIFSLDYPSTLLSTPVYTYTYSLIYIYIYIHLYRGNGRAQIGAQVWVVLVATYMKFWSGYWENQCRISSPCSSYRVTDLKTFLLM
jgi:hypothetical protein